MLRREVTRHSGVVQTMDDRSDDMNEIKTNPTWFVCCDSRRSGRIARERFPRIINTLLQPGRIYSYVTQVINSLGRGNFLGPISDYVWGLLYVRDERFLIK